MCEILSKSFYIFYKNLIHRLCKLLSKIQPINFFSVKNHVFRVTIFNMLENEIQAKNTKF